MYDEKTKLWKVKYDNGDTEERTLNQLILLKKRYEREKRYDPEANTKLPATTTAPTLSGSKRKKKKESTTVKKKAPAPPSGKKKKKTLVKKKKKPLTEKQEK